MAATQQALRTPPTDRYSIAHPANQYTHSQILRECVKFWVKHGLLPLEGKSIADIGCGPGHWMIEFLRWGAQPERIVGLDLDAAKTALARTRLPAADIRTGSAAQLPWQSAQFDLVSQFTMFTSILDPGTRRTAASEMLRIVKPSGAIFWYDFCMDNPNNKNVRGVKLEEIHSLFPDCRIVSKRVTLAPPLARLVAPVSWMGAMALEKLPFLRTHRIALIRKGR